MKPVGQVIGICANTSSDISRLLESEPLFLSGGVTSWSVYEFKQHVTENTTVSSCDPKLFVGLRQRDSGSDTIRDSLFESHQAYHENGGFDGTSQSRVIMMGKLFVCDGTKTRKQKEGQDDAECDGILIVFNAKTDADSKRYILNDPIYPHFSHSNSVGGRTESGKSREPLVTPVNQQDVDGMNLMMARTFGEKTVLDQVCMIVVSM
jgi:hypothetical protein